MKTELQALLQKIATRFPSNRVFADAVGLSQSRLGRAMKGTRGEETISVLSCLRLARVTGEPASTILRMAKKAEEAALIEELYGDAATPIEPEDREIVAAVRALSPRRRQLVVEMLSELAARERPGPKGHGARKTAR